MSGLRGTRGYNLKELLRDLLAEQSGVDEIYLFGSRAYNTGSVRSDCDLLVRVDPTLNTKSSDLRDFSLTRCPALDFFLCTDSRAVSCSNDSFVYAASFSDLVEKLDAVLLWSKAGGFADFAFVNSGNWVFETGLGIQYAMTSLPDAYVGEQAWHNKLKTVEAEGLPVRPFIGDTLHKAVVQIIDVARKMIFEPNDLGRIPPPWAAWR